VDFLQRSSHQRCLVVRGQVFGVIAERCDALLIGQHADRPRPIDAPHATIQPERVNDPQHRLRISACQLAVTLAPISATFPAVAAEPVTAKPAAETPAAETRAADPRLAQNPALSQIAAVDPVEARRLLDDIDRVLCQPAPPPMRGSPFDLDETDEALLADNPSLSQVFAHDPAAAVALLIRIKTAGSGRTGNGK
jgi:hypothetical protein